MTPQEQAIELQRPAKPAPLARTVGEDIASLLKAGKDEGVQPEDYGKLLDVYERIADRNARQAFNEALAALQEEAPPVDKTRPVMNRSGGHMYNYANRHDLLKVYRPLLVKHGFSTSFSTRPIDGNVYVICKLTHIQGHSEEGSFPFGPDSSGTMGEIQKRGSGLSYGQRYAFCQVLDIDLGDDNDGADPPGPVETITAAEALSLRDAIISLTPKDPDGGANKWLEKQIQRLCGSFGCKTLESLPASKVDAVWDAINKKSPKQKG